MELVYLWVEDYKNIHEQGFNFSPRFRCEYDGKTLTIDENDDYIPNFFGENINVTAIVGKNGSGKSSLLEFILDRLSMRHNNYPKNFIFIYRYDGVIYDYGNFEYKIVTELNIDKHPNYEDLLDYYKELISIHVNSEYKDIDLRSSHKIYSENNKYDKKTSNLVFIENYVVNTKQLNLIKENIFVPYIVKISIKMRGYSSTLNDDRDYYSNEDWKEINILIESLDEILFIGKDEIREKTFIERLSIIQKIFEMKYNKHKNKGKVVFLGDRISPDKYRFNASLLEKIPPIFKAFNDTNIELSMKDINIDILSYIKKLPYIFDVDILNIDKISIESLSFGEKQLLNQLHYILLHTSMSSYEEYKPPQLIFEDGKEKEIGDSWISINIEKVLIFLDEFEIGLHPQWQKKTIKYIINFLEVLNIDIHIILTTHSPFLLSDIPKQNIIFLDKDEQGNCKVVNGLKEKKQTFGANIHTLLSDSFFMEDGLMGEFAKQKINEIIDFHKEVKEEKKKEKSNLDLLKIRYEELKIKFWDIQSIIGEEYLRQVVKNHLIDIENMLDINDAKKEEAKRLREEADRLDPQND